MNMCFLIGKIIGKIEFNFILNSKNISIAIFEIEVKNKSIIKIKAYDEIADWCYQNLVENDIIVLEGKLNTKMEVVINEILKTNSY